MKRISFVLAILFIGLMAISLNAEASIFTDGGLTTFSFANQWTADVYWKVYAPGTYSGAITYNTSEYLYTYQIYNHESSSLPLSELAIGNPLRLDITDANYNTAENFSGIPVNGTIAPSAISADEFGAVFSFTSSKIPIDQSSYLLWFTSPYVPGWVSAGLQAPGYNDRQSVPGPVPEPASLAMLGMGLIGLAGTAIRKRFKA